MARRTQGVPDLAKVSTTFQKQWQRKGSQISSDRCKIIVRNHPVRPSWGVAQHMLCTRRIFRTQEHAHIKSQRVRDRDRETETEKERQRKRDVKYRCLPSKLSPTRRKKKVLFLTTGSIYSSSRSGFLGTSSESLSSDILASHNSQRERGTKESDSGQSVGEIGRKREAGKEWKRGGEEEGERASESEGGGGRRRRREERWRSPISSSHSQGIGPQESPKHQACKHPAALALVARPLRL